MRLTFKYRLFPTPAQRAALNRTLAICTRVYNEVLHTRRQAWQTEGASLTRYGTINLLAAWKVEQPWLAEVHAQVLQAVCTRVDRAFQSFLRRVLAQENPGYARCKQAGWSKSFTFAQAGVGWKLLAAGRLRLAKIGDLKIRLHRPIEGAIKTLTIRRDALRNWYACFAVEALPQALAASPCSVGVDLGLTHFATLARGEQVANPRFCRRDEKALAKAVRKQRACERGTLPYRKAGRVVQHLHQRIAKRRANFAHQLSRRLLDTFQILAFEDLNPSNRVKNHALAKRISDAAWNQLVQDTTYKAECAGRTLVLLDPRDTSQACARCGERVKKALSVRVHVCPACGLVLERDLNAALNIVARGLARLGACP